MHVITAAMPDSLCLLEFRDRFPDRFHDVGICEQLAVGLAAGLASQGKRPIFAVFATFLTRALDQVLNDVALHRLPVTFIVDRAGVTSGDGASTHGIYDVGMLRNIPGAQIYAPSSDNQLLPLLRRTIDSCDGPTFIRYAKWQPLASGTDADAQRHAIGDDVCLIAHGATLPASTAAAAELRSLGLSTTVWESIRLHPADPALLEDAMRHRVVVTVEDLAMGTGMRRELETAMSNWTGPTPIVGEVAPPAQFLPSGTREEVLEACSVDSKTVVQVARQLVVRSNAVRNMQTQIG